MAMLVLQGSSQDVAALHIQKVVLQLTLESPCYNDQFRIYNERIGMSKF